MLISLFLSEVKFKKQATRLEKNWRDRLLNSSSKLLIYLPRGSTDILFGVLGHLKPYASFYRSSPKDHS